MDSQLREGLTQLLTYVGAGAPPFPHERWLELYTRVFQVCSNVSEPRPRELYEDLSALLTEHCQEKLRVLQQLLPPAHTVAQQQQQQPMEDLLPAYLRLFRQFFRGMQYVADLTRYLGRWWITKQLSLPGYNPATSGVYPVELLGCVIWFDELWVCFPSLSLALSLTLCVCTCMWTRRHSQPL
jgi:hypothetical protein